MNVELNITLACNLVCPNCNRLCNLYRDRTEHMTLGQIERFVHQAKLSSKRVNKVKVVGGEPLLHPEFPAIYDILGRALDDGAIRGVKVNTNGTIPRPHVTEHPRVRWLVSRATKKCHAPFLWSPLDMGYKVTGPCSMPRRCGYSLDKYGWLPCSAAIMLVRLAHREELYRDEIPQSVWAMEELCPDCIFAMPDKWLAEHSRRPRELGRSDTEPTMHFRAMLAGYDGTCHQEPWREDRE